MERPEEGEEEENEEENSILRDRFRLSAIAIANETAKSSEMEVSETVVACISDMAFKITEQLGKDVEMFSQHGGRVSVNMEDVILSAHRNEHLLASLRCFADELKSHSQQPQRKRKKAVTTKE